MSQSDLPLALFQRTLESFGLLTNEDIAALHDLPVRIRVLEPSTYLTREGDPPEHCGVLMSGYAFRQKHTGDGLRQIVAIHIPGDAVDLQHLFLDVADHNVQMLTRGEVAFIARKELRELYRARRNIAHAMMTAILVESSTFREWVLNVGRRDARSRLAHVLCEFAVRMEKRGLSTLEGFELPVTQEQMADILGLTTVHVARTLKTLQSGGLISRNRRAIRFPNWERLREVADFNPRYLHLDEPHLAG